MFRRRTLGLLASAALATACSSTPSENTPADAGATNCPTGTHQLDDGTCDATLSWATSGAIPTARDHHATFLATAPSGTFLYVAGGAASHSASSFKNDVLRAAINTTDGSLGEWTSIGNLPNAVAGPAVAVIGRTLIISGGMTASGMIATTRLAHIQDDGTISAWTSGPALSSARFHHPLLVRGNRLYTIGGALGSDSTDDAATATLGEDGTLSDWTPVTKLPQSRSHHGAVIHDKWIFLVAGLSGNPANNPTQLKDVLRAEINADGSLGEWSSIGELPVSVATHSVVVHDGWLYTVGGIESNATFTDFVQRAQIQSDGSLGEWQEMPALPKGRGHVHQTPVLNDRWLYSVAGSTPHGTLADVFVGTFE